MANNDYRRAELENVYANGEHAAKLKISSDDGDTKWLDITATEFEQIKAVLLDYRNDTPEPVERVIFRKFPHNGEVIALFPDQYDARTGMIGSYLHVGQHGDTYPDFGDTKAADEHEYADLYAELGRQGYTNLKVVKRFGKLGK